MSFSEKEGLALDLAERSAGERSEPARSGARSNAARRGSPDPEVPAKARRRSFSVDYKLRVLREADRCRKPGEMGALLRREGLFSSQLAAWRQQRQSGLLGGQSTSKRGPKPTVNAALKKYIAEVERENRRLKRELAQAQTIIDIQKKISTLLGIPLNSPESGERD